MGKSGLWSVSGTVYNKGIFACVVYKMPYFTCMSLTGALNLCPKKPKAGKLPLKLVKLMLWSETHAQMFVRHRPSMRFLLDFFQIFTYLIDAFCGSWGFCPQC